MTDEALANAGYVNHINKGSKRQYTWEELKEMGCPTYITPEGWITWD
jgi:hypothetical protein